MLTEAFRSRDERHPAGVTRAECTDRKVCANLSSIFKTPCFVTDDSATLLPHRMRRFPLKNFGIGICGFALITSFIAGCGGNTGTGSNHDDLVSTPQVSISSVSTTTSPLTASGGRVAFQAWILHRSGTYLTTAAGTPRFFVKNISGKQEVPPQDLNSETPGDLGSGELDCSTALRCSKTFSGAFTLPANTTANPRMYQIVIVVPQVNGDPYQEGYPGDYGTVTVPGVSSAQ